MRGLEYFLEHPRKLALSDHYVACLEVGIPVPVHILSLEHSVHLSGFQVLAEEEDEWAVVDELLKSFQAELVQVVVNLDDFGLLDWVTVVESQHLLRVDEGDEGFNGVSLLYFHQGVALAELDLDVGLQLVDQKILRLLPLLVDKIREIVEIFRIVLSEVSNEILIDYFVPYLSAVKPVKFEFLGIFIELPFGGFSK